MAFEESQIQKHLEYLDKRAKDEDGDNFTPTQLYQVVNSQQEADEHNTKMKKYLENYDPNVSMMDSEDENEQYSRTISSDTALDKHQKKGNEKKKPQMKKEDASLDGGSMNDKRNQRNQASGLKLEVPKQKESESQDRSSQYLSPRDRMKARKAQLEQDKIEIETESRANKFNREEKDDSIDMPPSARDFDNDVIRQKNLSSSKQAGKDKDQLRQKSQRSASKRN